jgi:hypothetical protein
MLQQQRGERELSVAYYVGYKVPLQVLERGVEVALFDLMVRPQAPARQVKSRARRWPAHLSD